MTKDSGLWAPNFSCDVLISWTNVSVIFLCLGKNDLIMHTDVVGGLKVSEEPHVQKLDACCLWDLAGQAEESIVAPAQKATGVPQRVKN